CLPMPRQLEHVAMADQVRLDVGHGILEAVADAGLRSEVDNAFDLDRVGEGLERVGVGEVDLLEPEAIAELLLKLRQPRLLEPGIIIVIQTIDPDALVARLEQGASSRRADEPRGPSHQNSHGGFLGAAVRSAMAAQGEHWAGLELPPLVC